MPDSGGKTAFSPAPVCPQHGSCWASGRCLCSKPSVQTIMVIPSLSQGLTYRAGPRYLAARLPLVSEMASEMTRPPNAGQREVRESPLGASRSSLPPKLSP